MVGRGKGMIGTPGASGGWAGAGWAAAGWVIAGAGGAGGWLRWSGGLAAARGDSVVLRATDEAFGVGDPVFGRAKSADGFALTFEVVARPFALERRSELRGAPLPIRRYRSILLIQV
jgi:hypothetical protein